MRTTASSSRDATVLDRLRASGLRPTRQRLALAKLLFAHGPRHVTAESLFNEAKAKRVNLSLATVYNALHDFTEKGLLREISIKSGQSYFDTNTADHHHFYFEKTGKLQDVPLESVRITSLPETPEGETVERVDVVIRLSR
ncbi:MAG: transcriptional repressor [Rhodospirillaceae bacterium]|nr:transcriptional repressor [Rhodospirillaceae bacterium]